MRRLGTPGCLATTDVTTLTDGTLGELEQECLTQFLQALSNLRPYLVQCYDRKDFPTDQQ